MRQLINEPTRITESSSTIIENHSIGGIVDSLRKGLYLYITFTQSHWPEEAIPDSYDRSEQGLKQVYNSREPANKLLTMRTR